MFNWGRALFYALRWAMYGAAIGLLIGFVVSLGNGKFETAPAFAITLFWLLGIGRLGFEALNKSYPDA